MEEKMLLKAAMCTALIGIVGLVIVMQTTQAKEMAGNNSINTLEGDTVRLTGVIKKIDQNNNLTKMTIEHTCQTTALSFEQPRILKGEKVEITGEIKENNYMGKKESQIMVDEIKLIG